jgi:hypothetical protein
MGHQELSSTLVQRFAAGASLWLDVPTRAQRTNESMTARGQVEQQSRLLWKI